MKLLIAVGSAELAACFADCGSKYDVHICRTGAEALAFLETLQPELLLLDLSLPVIDGLTLLRKSDHRPGGIIGLTTLVSADVLEEAAEAGVHQLIRIPCPFRYILKHLDTLAENAPSPEA